MRTDWRIRARAGLLPECVFGSVVEVEVEVRVELLGGASAEDGQFPDQGLGQVLYLVVFMQLPDQSFRLLGLLLR